MLARGKPGDKPDGSAGTFSRVIAGNTTFVTDQGVLNLGPKQIGFVSDAATAKPMLLSKLADAAPLPMVNPVNSMAPGGQVSTNDMVSNFSSIGETKALSPNPASGNGALPALANAAIKPLLPTLSTLIINAITVASPTLSTPSVSASSMPATPLLQVPVLSAPTLSGPVLAPPPLVAAPIITTTQTLSGVVPLLTTITGTKPLLRLH